MNAHPTSSDWAQARGDKWSSQLAGMESMLHPIDEPLFQALQLDAPYRIADVGCGGGGTAFHLHGRALRGSVVHGFDISPKLVQMARSRQSTNAHTLTFEVADVATAQPEHPFDRLLSRFGIMFFADPQAAFANLARWIRPGGRFAFAVWNHPAENPGMSVPREVVSQLIDLPELDPEAPGPFRYANANSLRALLEDAGLGQLEIHPWRGELPIGGGLPPAEAAQFALAAFSSFGELLAQAGDEALREARQLLSARFSQHQRNGAVWMGASVHIFTGVRP